MQWMAALALFMVPATIDHSAPPDTPATPPTLRPYASELERSGITPQMLQREPRPKAALVSLFSTDDYPLESIRNEEQGTVAVVLRVDAEGRVRDCVVTDSSGYPALDSQTCRILWSRSQFEPARDKRGRPVESAMAQRIRWELPEPDPTPFKPWKVSFRLVILKSGGLADCTMATTGAMKPDESCNFFRQSPDAMFNRIRAELGSERETVVMETQFMPGPTAPPAPPGTSIFSRQVNRLTIDASGKPLQCKVIEWEGPGPMDDGCGEMLEQRFEPPGIDVGAVEATVVRTITIEGPARIDGGPGSR